MNTSLFVGLCEDAGFEVEPKGHLIEISTRDHVLVAVIDERVDPFYWIDAYKMSKGEAVAISEIAVTYALTPIEERE